MGRRFAASDLSAVAVRIAWGRLLREALAHGRGVSLWIGPGQDATDLMRHEAPARLEEVLRRHIEPALDQRQAGAQVFGVRSDNSMELIEKPCPLGDRRFISFDILMPDSRMRTIDVIDLDCRLASPPHAASM
jgi:hypothetical protein